MYWFNIGFNKFKLLGVIILLLSKQLIGQTQTWNQLEAEYNSLLGSKQNDLAVYKAKEIYNWVKKNEGDTCIHLPISLKYIGNAFVNNDSGIVYYDIALNILKKQKRENHIQAARLHHNKSNRYSSLNNKEFSLREADSSIQVLTYLNFPEYPFCTWPLNSKAQIYFSGGEFEKAEILYKQIVEITSKYKGNYSAEYATAITALANMYLNEYNYSAADPLYQEASKLYKAIYGESNVDYAMSLHNLGTLYHKANNNILAKDLFIEALKIKKDQLGSNNLNYAITLIGLGNVQYSLGESKDAKKTFKNVLNIYSKNYDTLSIEYSSTLNSIATSYFDNGEFLNAEELYTKSSDIIKSKYGSNHPEYARSLENIALVYWKRLNYTEAEIKFKEASSIFKNSLGNENTYYIRSLFRIGTLYGDMGKYSLAESNIETAISIMKKIKQEYTNDYASYINGLANLYAEQSLYSKAESLYVVAVKIHLEKDGENSLSYIESLNNLALIKLNSGKYLEAEKYIYEAYGKAKKYFPNNPNIIASTTLRMAFLNEDKGNFDLAESFYKEGLKIEKYSLGFNSPKYNKTLLDLGGFYESIGQNEKAENLYLEASQSIKNSLGIVHPRYARSLYNLGGFYLNHENYQAAEKCYLEALEIYKQTYGRDNKDYLLTLFNLGGVYSNLSNYYAAKNCFLEVYNSNLKSIENDTISYLKTSIQLSKAYYNLNDFKSSDKYLTEAEKVINPSIINANPEIADELAYFLFTFDKYKESESLYKIAITSYKEKNDIRDNKLLAKCLHNLSLVYLNMSKYDDAEITLNEALALKKKYYGTRNNNYNQSQYLLAQIKFKKGDYASSYKIFEQNYFQKNKEITDNFSFLSEKERELTWNEKDYYFSQLIEYSAKIYNDIQSSSALAYNSSLISKAILIEAYRGFNDAVNNSKDTTFINLYQDLKSLRKYSAKLTSEGSDKQILISTLDRQADSLDQVLSRKMSSYTDYKKNFSLTWKDVQANLLNDEASIEFAQYYDDKDSAYHYMALIVKPNDKYPQLVKLCNENELKALSPEKKLNEIYTLIWKPIINQLTGVKTIYYTPSGLLNNIPFQALYQEKDGAKEYLMDKYSMQQLTSTRYLALGLKKKADQNIETNIALFGGVNYNDFPTARADTVDNIASEAAFLFKNTVAQRGIDDSTRNGARYLPGTKKEVENIAALLKSNKWDVRVVEGKEASEGKIKSFSGTNSRSIVHIATHGFAFPDKEENKNRSILAFEQGNQKYKASDNAMIRSGLLFSGANMTWQGKGDSLLKTTNEDGVLTAFELSQLSLENTKLVVLSACETGKGAIQGSEGTFGLKRALKLAGVENMIVSLWKVPDDATMEMMTIFYTELSKTKKPIPSFEFAQKAMRTKYPNDPEKWAGFVFVR